MKARSVVFIVAGLAAALILTFPLRGFVERVIIEPLAYLFWMLGMLYRAVPQLFLWLLLMLGMLYVAVKSFYRQPRQAPPARRRVEQTLGPVENVARLLARKKTGVYFKWQLARTLSEIALDLQELSTHARSRDLRFPNGMQTEVRKYLDAGLKTSFADYASPGGSLLPERFRKPQKTPFDTDLEPVMQFLESQLESKDDRRRP